MTRILVVDDEPQLVRALRINLSARQHDVLTATDGEQALRSAAADRPEVIVLDLGLPDISGIEIVRQLRTWSPVPIVVLSGRTDSRDKIDALDAGADDYLTKPFSVGELLARIRAVTRRRDPGTAPAAPIQLGGHRIDLAGRTITTAGGSAPHLTKTEWQLLELLLREPGRLVGQRQLLQTVWGPTYLSETNYLRQFMAQLRRKLEPDPAHPQFLLTEPGMGYRYQPPASGSEE